MNEIPTPFEHELFLESRAALDSTTFLVCAFFTRGSDLFERCAVRLARSCERFELPYSIYRVPHVHQSISPRGVDDLRFTKANFIAFNLERFPDKDVLYMDADTFFMQRPSVLLGLKRSACDFAVYNWLCDPQNEAYVPANRKLQSKERESDFYVFSHRIGWTSSDQLICSGGVQYYGNTRPARALLQAWQRVIGDNPRSADDQCLDFAYNNPSSGCTPLRSTWLDKSHLRHPWWPQIEPVVLHPPLPSASRAHAPLAESGTHKRVHLDRCARNLSAPLFPVDCAVDTTTGIVYRIEEGKRLVQCGRHDGRFWIYAEDVDLGAGGERPGAVGC
jgi:hypothetical protein